MTARWRWLESKPPAVTPLAAQYTKLQESNAQLQDEVEKNVGLLSDLGERQTPTA